jgi:nucleoside-diphosphate-sugar epimerase
MLIDNLRMMASVCLAIKNRPPGQVIYVSSDAVYADSDAPLSESSCAEPSSLHGVMHLARELMLKEVFNDSLCVVRPTLIYGPDDPHNGYGPNRFRRLANAGQDITLFGDGEERRDHVYIDDVAELIGRCSLHSSRGILNIACGTVFSFRDIAEIVVALSSQRVVINSSPRIGSMPHRGFRPFDPSLTHLMFPDFAYTQLPAGLGLCQQHHDEN